MARHAREAGISFGSDSFLDIIANIVGILIILIVVAGVRVSQAPIAVEATAAQAAAVLPLPKLVEPPPPTPSPELVARAERLRAELATAEAEAAEHRRRLEQLTEERRQFGKESPRLVSELAEAQRRRMAAELAVRESRENVQQAEAELTDLFLEIDAAERQKPDPQKIEHRLSHISRTVAGNELHFLLSADRVSFVPIGEFERRMQAQVQQARHWLIKGQPSRGTIGPLGGFTMEYTMALQPASVLEQLHRGASFARLKARGVFRPEPELEVETGDEALTAGSRFFLALKSAERDTTLTLWVHPDSFALYRRLQEFAHKEGFLAAARPLLEGMPITFSTNGSKSAGQ